METNPVILALVLTILLLLLLCFLSVQKPDAFETPRKTVLYIYPMWGLANRLRVMRVAYGICANMGWKLVVVHVPDKGYDAPHIKNLVDIPGIEYKDSIPSNTTLMKFNVKNDCIIKTSISDIQASVKNGRVAIRACGFKLRDNIKEINLMYNRMKPRGDVLRACDDVLRVLQNTEKTVGVHIRQGSIPDYQYGYFFGKLNDKGNNALPTTCCHQDRSLNRSPCTRHAPVIERFIRIMKTMPEDSVFFVCSDRPGCIDVLENTFPGRILTNKWVDTSTNDAFGAFCDWWCLSRCKKLICSEMSSFSHEAKRISGAKTVFITM